MAGQRTIRVPIRIDGNVTSVSLRKNVVALWLFLNADDDGDSNNEPSFHLRNFVYTCLDTWNNTSAKGFSDYITDRMFSDFLDTEEFTEYKKILDTL